MVFISIGCGTSNAQLFKDNYPIFNNKLDTLFSYYEHGKFDSLYSHYSDSGKQMFSRSKFIEISNSTFAVRRLRNFKIIHHCCPNV